MRVLWIGPRDEVGEEIETIYNVAYVSFDAAHLPDGAWDVAVGWGGWPRHFPLPDIPLILCLEDGKVSHEMLQRAAVVLWLPVRPGSLVREVEGLLGNEWSGSF